MDRLEAMTTLLAVVDTGSLSAASRRLHMPLTTVSRRISELEAHLRTRLLNRTTRRLTLTDAGDAYVAACRRIVEQLEEAERVAAGEYQAPRGELTVTAPMVFGRVHVVPVVAGFMEAYPDVKLDLRLSDRVLDLQEEHVDVAVRIGELPDSAMLARKLGTLRRIVCASPDYLERCGVPDTPEDIAGHECVVFRGFERPEGWAFAGKSGKATVPVRSRITLDTAEAVVEAGIAGIGLIRVFCYHVIPTIRQGKLKALLVDFELAGPPVHILHPGGGLMPLKVRAFLDYSTARLQARVAASV